MKPHRVGCASRTTSPFLKGCWPRELPAGPDQFADQAKRAGCSRVYWQTHETNHTAMQLYDKVAERSGFVVYRKML